MKILRYVVLSIFAVTLFISSVEARYYDPESGRFLSEDPLGFGGGDVNFYAYVGNNPVNHADPLGLATFMCMQQLHAFPWSLDNGRRSIIDLHGNPFYHQYPCVYSNGVYTCGGQDRGDSWLGPLSAPGKKSSDTFKPSACEVKDNSKCVDNCVIGKINNPQRPHYGIPFGTDCQEWANNALLQCQQQCAGK